MKSKRLEESVDAGIFPERGKTGAVLLALRLVHPHLEPDRREVRADEHISVIRQAAEPARESPGTEWNPDTRQKMSDQEYSRQDFSPKPSDQAPLR